MWLHVFTVNEQDVDMIKEILRTLVLTYDHLPKGDSPHWFCQRADELTRETAKFLIRMFAYDGQKAKDWRVLLLRCLMNCADCVMYFQESKVTTRNT